MNFPPPNSLANRVLGVLGCALLFGAGSWLIVHGMRGVRSRRIRKPFREHEWFTDRSAVNEGTFRIIVGVGLLALVVWALSQDGL
jgi:hypothetical protein